MRKVVFTFLSVFALMLAFQSCSKTRTYADRLADEKKAIDKYIKKNKIKVISYQEFLANDTITDVEKNEYVQLQTGLYLQILSRGSANPVDTFKNGDDITLRLSEYNIIEGYETIASNGNNPYFSDVFRYTKTNNNIKGEFFGEGTMLAVYGSKVVPAGWLIPLKFLRKDASMNLIVSSKLGHMSSLQQVYPYAYKIWHLDTSKW